MATAGGGLSDAIMRRLMGLGPDPSQNVSNNLMDIMGGIGMEEDEPFSQTGLDTGPSSVLNSVTPSGMQSGSPGFIPPSQPGLIKSPTGNYRRTGNPPAIKPKPRLVSGNDGRSRAVASRLAGILRQRKQGNAGSY
jgi:hypothetical protein